MNEEIALVFYQNASQKNQHQFDILPTSLMNATDSSNEVKSKDLKVIKSSLNEENAHHHLHSEFDDIIETKIIEVDKLDTISNDVNKILKIPKTETDHLVEKLIKDVKSINENLLNKTLLNDVNEKKIIDNNEKSCEKNSASNRKSGKGKIIQKLDFNEIIPTICKEDSHRKNNINSDKNSNDNDLKICENEQFEQSSMVKVWMQMICISSNNIPIEWGK